MIKNNLLIRRFYSRKGYINIILKVILSVSVLFLLSCSNGSVNQKQIQKDILILEKEITHLLKKGERNPLQAVLMKRKITIHSSSIQIEASEDETISKAIFPDERPFDVTEEEWQALLKSDVSLSLSSSEINKVYLILLDLNEDGKRDFVVDIYGGGTGMFSYFHVYKRIGDSFQIVTQNRVLGGLNGDLYSINGRGGDQQGEWISINGRVYLAYRNGKYGRDQLILLRAFDTTDSETIPVIEVNYRYQHTLLEQTYPKEDGKVTPLSPKHFAVLQKQLDHLSQYTDFSNPNIYGECSVPKELDPEKRAQYFKWPWFYPTDLNVIIANFPVYDSTGCHTAQLVSHPGYHSTERTPLTYTQPTTLVYNLVPYPDDKSPNREFNIQSIRIAIGVKNVLLNRSLLFD